MTSSASPAPDAPVPGVPVLGVVVVTFNSSDVILDCLESLLASTGVRLRIAVIDNASTDGTPDLIRDWAAGKTPYVVPGDLPFALEPAPKPLPYAQAAGTTLPAVAAETALGHRLTMIETGLNGGFAAGVNRGLALLAADPEVPRFWVLNPDGVAPPGTAAAFAAAPAPEGGFALMGGRVNYLDPPDRIQMDGGLINRLTGVTGNIHLGRSSKATSGPGQDQLAFISGASMVASRQFYEAAGPMPEDYFLYYEEVDWALRRGRLPLLWNKDAMVYHRAGTSIGSPTLDRPATPFSLYFIHRGRMKFQRRYNPMGLPTAWAYSMAKAAQLALKGYRHEALTVLRASHGLPPPPDVRKRLTPEAARLAFGR